MQPQRLQDRRRIFGKARERPVRLVQTAMAVTGDKRVEGRKKRRSGEGATEVRCPLRLTPQPVGRSRFGSGGVRERHQVERLLRAHRLRAGGKVRVEQLLERHAGARADLFQRGFVDQHAAEEQHDLEPLRAGLPPPLQGRQKLPVGHRRRIDGRDLREIPRDRGFVLSHQRPRAQVPAQDPDEIGRTGEPVAERRPAHLLVLGADIARVAERSQHVGRGGSAYQAHVPQLREVEIEPAVERLHHRSQHVLGRHQPAHVPPLGGVENVFERVERLRRGQFRQHFGEIGARPLDVRRRRCRRRHRA